MADRIEQKYMSYDDWKALGPLFQPAEAEGDRIYDGTTRERIETPNWTKANLGGPNKILGNPAHSGRRDAFTNAHSQWLHIVKTLDAGGDDALKLVREAAKLGDKMNDISERRHGNGDAWVALASDGQTAKVLREFITTTLEHFPPAKGVKRQELPTSPEDAKLGEILSQMEQKQPRRFRKRILESGHIRFANGDHKEQSADRSFEKTNRSKSAAAMRAKPRHYSGAIAIFADDGLEDQAADFAVGADKRLAILPEKNAALWKALEAKRSKEAFFPRAYNPNSKQRAATDDLALRADAGVFYWNGDHTSRVFAAAAEFSRQGKAVRVHGPDGKELPLYETLREAENAHMSKKDYAMSLSHHAFDMPAREPVAHFGLSLVKDEKLGSIKDADVNRIAHMDESINDIAAMATTAQGREYLLKDMKISSGGVKLLGDENAMNNARQSFLEIRREMQAENVDIIGPKDYPASLAMSGKAPPYMFIQGDKDFFRTAENIIGITGSPAHDDRTRRLVSSPAAKAVSSLTMQSAPVAYVQGQTPVDVPETGPQIMIATAGNAHTSEKDREKENRVLENGGVVLRSVPPHHASFYFDSKAWNEERGKKGKLVGVPATSNAHTERMAAGMLASMSQVLVVTDLDRSESTSHQHTALSTSLAVGEARAMEQKTSQAKAIGGRPVVLNFSGYEGISHISGNKALLGSTGAKALEKAGFGNSVTESLPDGLKDKRLVLDAGPNPEKAMENIVTAMRDKTLAPYTKATQEKSRGRETVTPEM